MREFATRAPSVVRGALQSARRESEHVWRVSGCASICLLATPFLFLLATCVVRALDRASFRALFRENGPAEWAQVAGFAVALIASAMLANQLARSARRIHAALYGALSCGLFFLIGEELAWGQFAFELETPRELAALNSKGELSLHNVATIEPLFNVAKLMIGVYGTFGFLALRWLRGRWQAAALDYFIVPWFLASSFFVLFAQRILRLTVLREGIPANYGEFEELCFAFGLAAFTGLAWWRLRLESASDERSRGQLWPLRAARE